MMAKMNRGPFMAYETAKAVYLTKIEELLKGKILHTCPNTYILVESISYYSLAPTDPQYEAFSRYLYIKGTEMTISHNPRAESVDIRIYKSTYANLLTKYFISEYKILDLYNEIIQHFPIVKNIKELKKKVHDAKKLADDCINTIFQDDPEDG